MLTASWMSNGELNAHGESAAQACLRTPCLLSMPAKWQNIYSHPGDGII